MRKVLSLILVILVLLTSVPVTFAEEKVLLPIEKQQLDIIKMLTDAAGKNKTTSVVVDSAEKIKFLKLVLKYPNGTILDSKKANEFGNEAREILLTSNKVTIELPNLGIIDAKIYTESRYKSFLSDKYQIQISSSLSAKDFTDLMAQIKKSSKDNKVISQLASKLFDNVTVAAVNISKESVKTKEPKEFTIDDVPNGYIFGDTEASRANFSNYVQNAMLEKGLVITISFKMVNGGNYISKTYDLSKKDGFVNFGNWFEGVVWSKVKMPGAYTNLRFSLEKVIEDGVLKKIVLTQVPK